MKTELIHKHIQKSSAVLSPPATQACRDPGERRTLYPPALSSGPVASVGTQTEEWLPKLLYLRRLTTLEGPGTDPSSI